MHAPHSFRDLLPGLEPWVDGLATDPTAMALQNAFAWIEIIHFLGLFCIGACVIAVSLRLIGVGIAETTPAGVLRNTRLWLHLGVVAAIGSGLLLGLSNADKLYKNAAFLWKMIAMLAAMGFSYAVLIPTAKAEGAVPAGARIGLAISFLLWGLSLLVMLTNAGGNVGVIHLMFAAALIAVVVLRGRARWLFLAALAALVLALQIATHVVVTDPFSTAYMTVNKVWMWFTGLFLLAAIAADAWRARRDSPRLARLVGYASLLAWVTVGAGGRWIGYT
jgi:hypothetical protein